MKTGEILVIDLFAGPGGLGEGLASCEDESGKKPFKIGVSVEKEPSAHRTLTTRAFFRKTAESPEARAKYYEYVKGKISRDDLFKNFPILAEEAQQETMKRPKALGQDNSLIHARITELVSQHQGPVVVIGGPPCQAYSLAGRSRNAGKKDYDAKSDHRHFLYEEYLNVIAIAQPKIFVMENVRGILSSKIDGKLIFPQILRDLQNPSDATNHPCSHTYRIYSFVKEARNPQSPQYMDTADFLIRSEKYGIPQARHRVILLGVRDDVKAIPQTLELATTPVTTQQAIGDLPKLRSGVSKMTDSNELWERVIREHSSILEKIFSEKHLSYKAKAINLAPIKGLNRESTAYAYHQDTCLPSKLNTWIKDSTLNHVLNHETRAHIQSDLLRYAFCATYAQTYNGTSPKSKDFPAQLAPSHANWKSGKHADRFRVQVATKAATTVTSHISKDGHYFIHYDPQQCRSLTVREAARLQTFPDNYIFEGNRTQQYVQVGNAVPPYLARQIAQVVMKLLDDDRINNI